MITSGLVVQNRSAYASRFPSSVRREYNQEYRPAVFESGKKLPAASAPNAIENGVMKYKIPITVNYKQIFGKRSTPSQREFYLLNGITQRQMNLNNLGPSKKLKSLRRDRFMIGDETPVPVYAPDKISYNDFMDIDSVHMDIDGDSAARIKKWATYRKKNPSIASTIDDVVAYQAATKSNSDGSPTSEGLDQTMEIIEDSKDNVTEEQVQDLLSLVQDMPLEDPEIDILNRITYDNSESSNLVTSPLQIFDQNSIHNDAWNAISSLAQPVEQTESPVAYEQSGEGQETSPDSETGSSEGAFSDKTPTEKSVGAFSKSSENTPTEKAGLQSVQDINSPSLEDDEQSDSDYEIGVSREALKRRRWERAREQAMKEKLEAEMALELSKKAKLEKIKEDGRKSTPNLGVRETTVKKIKKRSKSLNSTDPVVTRFARGRERGIEEDQ